MDELSLAFMDEIPTPERGQTVPPARRDADEGWSPARVMHLSARWAEGATGAQIAAELGGVSRSAVLGKVNKLKLARGPGVSSGKGRPRLSRAQAEESTRDYAARHGSRGTRKAFAGLGDDTTFSRFVKIKGFVPKPRVKQLAFDSRHPAFIEGRSVFSRRGVKKLGELKNLLVSGHSNVKIGNDVRKGRFPGYDIFTLTLPERTTCPRSCLHWTDCYGNNMPYAKRVDVSEPRELERRLEAEVAGLLAPPKRRRATSRKGVLIRLHALGDFFDEQYVEFWINMLAKYDRLAIFGYTARRQDDAIGATIQDGKRAFGRRFAIRWSDGGYGRDCTVSVLKAEDCPPTAFVCPEQTGRVDGCGKCGACWTGDKDVAFILH